MAITWTHVLEIAPELSVVAPSTRAALLEDVALQVSASAWGTRADLASKYLAAHLATLSQRGGAGPSGAVGGESVGDVSISYLSGTPPANATDYASTTYGREFARLLRLLPQRIGLVI